MSIPALIFDLVVIGIIVLGLIIGRAIGFLKSLYFLGIVVISVVLSNICGPYVNKGLEVLKVEENVEIKVCEVITDLVPEGKEESIKIDELLEKINLPSYMEDTIVKGFDTGVSQGKEMIKAVSKSIAETVTDVLAKVLTVVSVIACLIIISLVLKIITKIPVIDKIDAFGGSVVGIAVGIAAVIIACAVVYAIGLTKVEGNMAEIIRNSVSIKIVDKIGLLRLFVR